MCGIAGAVTANATVEATATIEAAMAALAHRGPDDRRLVAEDCGGRRVHLAHTRLAIIDLTPGGAQPMTTPDGRHTIIFNGELYNYIEIRSRLVAMGVRFSSESDTEVLLAAWAAWGPACLAQFVGMFAFAVLDRHERTLTLVRDAFGVKPLFYCTSPERTCFASELPALLGLAGLPRRMNDAVAVDYLVTSSLDLGPESFVEGICALLPAHLLTLDLRSGETRIERWWNPSIEEVRGRTREAAAEQLRSLFLESVRLHMRSDVPVGIALSGGIDSSAIACAVRHEFPDADLHTFSYVAEHGAVSEEPWIDAVNEATRAVPHKIRIGGDDLDADLDALIRAQGEPFGGTMLYAQYRIFRAARDAGIKVVLEGQGGDEMLGGYAGFPGFVMRSRLESLDLTGAFRFARQWSDANRHRGTMRWRALAGELPLPGRIRRAQRRWRQSVERLRWLRQDAAAERRYVAVGTPFRGSARGRRLSETLMLSMTRYSLPHLLRYGDRNAMAFSIENRVPFVTTKLAEFVLSLPEEFLVSADGETKSLFRQAMRGIVPSVVLDRRDKVGFSTPMGRWLKGAMLRRMPQLAGIGKRSVVDPGTACGFVATELAAARDREIDWMAWRVFNLLAWQREFGIASGRA
jgi:asparagine synthase (glutamine-hydrolysing)